MDQSGLTHNHLGVVRAHMGRDEEAAAHFERSTEVGGAGGEAESNLALLTQERDSERAVKLLERALDLGEERAKEHLARLRL